MCKIKKIFGLKSQSAKHCFIFKTIGGIDVLSPKRGEPDPKKKAQEKIKNPGAQVEKLKRFIASTTKEAARGEIRDLQKLGQKSLQRYKKLDLRKHKTISLGTGEDIVQLSREIRKQRHLHPKRRISCQICGLKGNDRKSLLARCQSRHSICPEEKRILHCGVCRKSLNSERQQNDHNLGKLYHKNYRKLHPSKFNWKF